MAVTCVSLARWSRSFTKRSDCQRRCDNVQFPIFGAERIPEHAALSNWKLDGGRCLDHYQVLMSLSDSTDYVLCMGPAQNNMLHCWLENDWRAVDLTQPTKFFDRGEYYAAFGIAAGEIKRYSRLDALFRAASAVEFWDFDVSKFSVHQP